VLLGNVVLYVYFTQLWPASVVDQVWQFTRQALDRLADMGRQAAAALHAHDPHDNHHRDRVIGDASIVASHLADTRRALELAGFEGRYTRPSQDVVDRIEAIDDSIRRICSGLLTRPLGLAAAERLAAVARRTASASPPALANSGSEALRAATAPTYPVSLEDEIRRLEKLVDGR